MRPFTREGMTCVTTHPVRCEWCQEVFALPKDILCKPCRNDFECAELEGLEMTAEDFEGAEADAKGKTG